MIQRARCCYIFVKIYLFWTSPIKLLLVKPPATLLQHNCNASVFLWVWVIFKQLFWRWIFKGVLLSKHLLVLKTSSTPLQCNNFTSSWRHLDDILQDVLKMSWRHVLKTSWRTLWRQTKNLLVISVSNKSKCASNKTIFLKSVWKF